MREMKSGFKPVKVCAAAVSELVCLPLIPHSS